MIRLLFRRDCPVCGERLTKKTADDKFCCGRCKWVEKK